MLIPIKCLTCGFPVGRVAPLFNFIRSKRVDEYLKDRQVVPPQIMVDAHLRMDMSDIFVSLGIPAGADCCQKTLACSMDFRLYA